MTETFWGDIRPKVGWDLDGVFYKFAESVWETMVRLGKAEGEMPPATHWHFYRDLAWGEMTDEAFVALCHEGADMGIVFTFGGYDAEAVRQINKLFWMDYETIIITDRSFGSSPSVSEQATLKALRDHGVWYDQIHFTADKAAIDIDYMIDDKLENYDALDAVGVNVYLLNRPWNYVYMDNRRRVDTIAEYTELIIQETLDRQTASV